MDPLEELVFGKTKFEVSSDEEEHVPEKKKQGPVWIDPDDALLMIPPERARILTELDPVSGERFNAELLERFSKSTKNADVRWAFMERNRGQEIDYNTVSAFTGKYIPSDHLNIVRVSDFESSQVKGAKAVVFSPTEQQAALLGNKGLVTICSYSAKTSKIIYEIPLDPKTKAYRKCLCYSADGTKIFIGCQRGIIQSLNSFGKNLFNIQIPDCRNYDVVSVKCSENLLAAVAHNTVYFFNPNNNVLLKTIQTSIKEIKCGTFTDDGAFFIAAGSDGRGHIFRTAGGAVEALPPFQLDDRQAVTAIDSRGALVAVGTESGVLYVFEIEELRRSSNKGLTRYPKAVVTKMNLLTATDGVAFNPSGELLFFSTSEGERGKITAKVLHVRSKRVFDEWPTPNTPLGYVRGAAFDPSSRFLAIASHNRVSLWELPFYRDDGDAVADDADGTEVDGE